MTPGKSYIKAGSFDHAIALAVEHDGNARFLAGGTDLMVNRVQGNGNEPVLIDITGIQDLDSIRISESFSEIGPLVTLETLAKYPGITARYPALAEAALSVASPVIRKTATLGGNLLCENRCSFYNQSEWWREAAGYCLKTGGPLCLASGGSKHCYAKFVSDTAIALISLGAIAEVADAVKMLKIPLEDIYSGDGLNPHHIDRKAFLVNILVPFSEGTRTVFRKLRKRASLDFTSLTTAVTRRKDGRIRIVLGGIHAKPVVVDGSPGASHETLISDAVSASRIVDNDTYSRKYRKEMIRVFLLRSLSDV